MLKTDGAYITSERFIHDDLVVEAAMGLCSLYETWATQSRIDPFILVWPSEPIEYHGHKTAAAVPFDLPERREQWSSEVRTLAQKYRAYGLLLVEQLSTEVLVIFESSHGTKSWRLPIKDHGDVKTLGGPTELTDTDSIGILWASQQGLG